MVISFAFLMLRKYFGFQIKGRTFIMSIVHPKFAKYFPLLKIITTFSLWTLHVFLRTTFNGVYKSHWQISQLQVNETTTMKENVLSKTRKTALSTAYVKLRENSKSVLENCYSMEIEASKLIRESGTSIIELETSILPVFWICQKIP